MKLEDQMAQMFRDICCGNIEVIYLGKCYSDLFSAEIFYSAFERL